MTDIMDSDARRLRRCPRCSEATHYVMDDGHEIAVACPRCKCGGVAVTDVDYAAKAQSAGTQRAAELRRQDRCYAEEWRYDHAALTQLLAETMRERDDLRRELDGTPSPAKQGDTARRWIVLRDYGPKKISVIRALREIVPGLGLREAKDIVESGPIVLASIGYPIAARLLNELSEAGALIELATDETKPDARAYIIARCIEAQVEAAALRAASDGEA